jgi:hypothetical protein
MRRHDHHYTEANRLAYLGYLRSRMIDEGVIVPSGSDNPPNEEGTAT